MGDRYAEQSGEGQLRTVVEVVLAAEEDHLVVEQRLVDLFDRSRIKVTAELYAVDSGADAAAQLGDGYRVCHGCLRPCVQVGV